MNNDWKPISEAKKDGSLMLLAFKSTFPTSKKMFLWHQTVGWWDVEEKAWYDGSQSDEEYVELFPTHFQPLTEPPTE